MVVIKTAEAAEHSVYISMLPKGLRSFMKGRASHCAQSAMRRVYRGGTESWDTRRERIFLPVCYIEQVYSFAMTGINFEDFNSFDVSFTATSQCDEISGRMRVDRGTP